MKENKLLRDCETIELINELINRPGVWHRSREGEAEFAGKDGWICRICTSDIIEIKCEVERSSGKLYCRRDEP